MQVSFGKQIPLMKCHITDWERDKNVPACFFEVDCKDKEDLNFIKSIEELGDYWYYNHSVAKDMKHLYDSKYENNKDCSMHFYFLKTKDYGTIGICEVGDVNDKLDLYYIETNQSGKYKYAGLVMMAALGKIVLNDGKRNFNIIAPSCEAVDFYTKKCGFKVGHDGLLTMKARKISKLIRKAQRKTHSKILDLEG